MKTCTRCGVCKPLDQFLWKIKADGLRQPHCKPCNQTKRDKDLNVFLEQLTGIAA